MRMTGVGNTVDALNASCDMRAGRQTLCRRSWPAIPAALLGVLVFVLAADAQKQAEKEKTQTRHEPPPYWAYEVNPPASASDEPAKPADDTPRHVPGSSAVFTLTQVEDFFNPPDWHPAGHPAMPEIVAHGRKPEVYACGYCHLPNGQGRPENANLTGLPVAYIVQQMMDFERGLRKSSEPRHLPVATMIANETKASEAEILAAAEYFSGMKARPWIRVVETKTVPKTHVAGWMLVPSRSGENEPIGQRIIEMPENVELTELRDDASGFVAYVPVGSIKMGEDLVRTGGAGKTVPCATCHGPDLKGMGKIPPIAGRSPSYVVRQLYDIQSGARAGVATQLMKPAVANLTVNDMLSIAAYTASLHP